MKGRSRVSIHGVWTFSTVIYLESAMKEKLRAKEREMDACICRRKICHDQENMYRIGVGLKETHRSTKKNVNFRGGPKREPRSKHRMVANQRKKKTLSTTKRLMGL